MENPGGLEQLDLRPARTWRRFVPAWLRSLIWVDSAASYDAFLSYSWKSDSALAPIIQSVLQRFLCPWYRVRARTVFRDLSCLPAGSSLEEELFNRLDRSHHLIVLASPAAAHSRGMELEARYWFSRPRDGQVLVIVTDGENGGWNEIRDRLIPAAIRGNLRTEPIWIPLYQHREQILDGPVRPDVRGELVEDLKQVILCLYPGRDWGQLQGEERAQRRPCDRIDLGPCTLVSCPCHCRGRFWNLRANTAPDRPVASTGFRFRAHAKREPRLDYRRTARRGVAAPAGDGAGL
jgi:hypothetical protein